MDRAVLLKIQDELRKLQVPNDEKRKHIIQDGIKKLANTKTRDNIEICFGKDFTDTSGIYSNYANLEDVNCGLIEWTDMIVFRQYKTVTEPQKSYEEIFPDRKIIYLSESICDEDSMKLVRRVLCKHYYYKAITTSQEEAEKWITTPGVADKIIKKDKGSKLERGI